MAKPATRLKVGDLITVEFGTRRLVVKVLELKEHVLKNDSHMLYEIISEEKIEVNS